MEAFLTSCLSVSLAEIGDKTQLLTLLLIARYPKPWSIALGILVATLVNHGLSAWLGEWIAAYIPQHWLPWLIGCSFIALGAWILIPDKEDDETANYASFGAFIMTMILFFLAEIGDKTQIATVVLAAKYHAFLAVLAGTTIGMMIANVPVLIFGQRIMTIIPANITRKASFALFVLVGLATIVIGGLGITL